MCTMKTGAELVCSCRYLNDKLLRDMAGALTANDMEALFKPVRCLLLVWQALRHAVAFCA